MGIFRKLSSLIWQFLLGKNPPLSFWNKHRARKALSLQITKFKHKNKRMPNRNELFLLIVSASHDVVTNNNARAHYLRQRIRKYLLKENGIEYKIR